MSTTKIDKKTSNDPDNTSPLLDMSQSSVKKMMAQAKVAQALMAQVLMAQVLMARSSVEAIQLMRSTGQEFPVEAIQLMGNTSFGHQVPLVTLLRVSWDLTHQGRGLKRREIERKKDIHIHRLTQARKQDTVGSRH